MILQPFIEKDLGHVSYIIADNNEAVIIDPKRNIDEYIEFLKKNDLELKYIINTHTHADYIGGHLELIEEYSMAKNIFQKDVPAEFDFIKVKENDIFNVGNLKLNILETPGHTPFCISILVKENDIDKYIFTGDFLFVGDIGRPDLLGHEKLNELIEMSYNSANKLWNLRDDIIIFSSHMEGSLCGKNLSNNYFSTIGLEKRTNSTFKLSYTKNRYIEKLLNLKIETPLFFQKMAKINIKGPRLLKDVKQPKYLLKNKFFKEEGIIIDFRHPRCFKSGYIKDSINVYEYSNILLIIGSLIDNEEKLLLVGNKNTNFNLIVKKLRLIGFDNIVAILDEDVSNLDNLIVFKEKTIQKIIDLEKDIQLKDITNLDKNIEYDIRCKNGYKSMAVKSFLKKRRKK